MSKPALSNDWIEFLSDMTVTPNSGCRTSYVARNCVCTDYGVCTLFSNILSNSVCAPRNKWMWQARLPRATITVISSFVQIKFLPHFHLLSEQHSRNPIMHWLPPNAKRCTENRRLKSSIDSPQENIAFSKQGMWICPKNRWFHSPVLWTLKP